MLAKTEIDKTSYPNERFEEVTQNHRKISQLNFFSNFEEFLQNNEQSLSFKKNQLEFFTLAVLRT